jgi:hypothetical protein
LRGFDVFIFVFVSLFIADDDGEWDTDFPPLDNQELISKFSFTHLALVPSSEMSSTDSVRSKSESKYSFLLPNGNTFKISVKSNERGTLTLGHIIKTVLEDSGWSKQNIPSIDYRSYHLEKLAHPNMKFRDLSMTLHDSKCRDFCLVRNGAKSVQAVQANDVGAR